MLKGYLSSRMVSLAVVLFLLAVIPVCFVGCQEGTDESAAPPPSGTPAAPASSSSASTPAPETQAAVRENQSPGAMRREDAMANAVTVRGNDDTTTAIAVTDEGKATITVTDAAGKEKAVTEIGLDKLAAEFSADFPVYTGATVNVSKTTETGDTVFVVSMETPDAISKVIDFYNEALPKNGFDIAMTMDVPEGKMIHFQKGDKTAGAVTITTQDKNTVAAVSLMISK